VRVERGCLDHSKKWAIGTGARLQRNTPQERGKGEKRGSLEEQQQEENPLKQSEHTRHASLFYVVTRTQRTRAHFNPQYWFLYHMGLY
jgi:hypothetical protein